MAKPIFVWMLTWPEVNGSQLGGAQPDAANVQ